MRGEFQRVLTKAATSSFSARGLSHLGSPLFTRLARGTPGSIADEDFSWQLFDDAFHFQAQ